MPLYAYDCLECKLTFEIRHSYGAKNILCDICKSPDIIKNLSSSAHTAIKITDIKNKAGDEVKKAIESGKHELEEYKKTKKDRVYDKK